MTMVCGSVSTVRMPFYEGFNQFVIWPDTDSVSSIMLCSILITMCLLQSNSSYCLVDYQEVESFVPSGFLVELHYYPGCCYVAHKAKDVDQVF